jgi:hypothetical protein
MIIDHIKLFSLGSVGRTAASKLATEFRSVRIGFVMGCKARLATNVRAISRSSPRLVSEAILGSLAEPLSNTDSASRTILTNKLNRNRSSSQDIRHGVCLGDCYQQD